MKAVTVSTSALRRLLLAQQGLLHARTASGEVLPWNQQLVGAQGALQALERLEAIQLDPVAVVERNHHLVLYNRLQNYRPQHLEALYPNKQVFEYWAQARCILPIQHYGLFDDLRQKWRFDHPQGPIAQAAEHIRAQLAHGPLPSRMLDSGQKVQGYWGFATKATSQALEHLWEAGEVVVAYRKGDERHFALSQQWLPPIPPTPNPREKALKFVRAYGVLDQGDPRLGWQQMAAPQRRDLLEALVTEGVLLPLDLPLKRRYYLYAPLLPLLEKVQTAKVWPKVYLLSPLDNLLWRRERIQDLWGFAYKWEIYVPEAKRQYGPYVLPVLEGEHLVARADLRLERAKGVLRLHGLWWENTPDRCQLARVHKAMQRLAQYLEAKLEA